MNYETWNELRNVNWATNRGSYWSKKKINPAKKKSMKTTLQYASASTASTGQEKVKRCWRIKSTFFELLFSWLKLIIYRNFLQFWNLLVAIVHSRKKLHYKFALKKYHWKDEKIRKKHGRFISSQLVYNIFLFPREQTPG